MPMFDDETEPAPGETVDRESPGTDEARNLPETELIVEDGTVVPSANVYCDLDYALKYCVEKGYLDWKELTDEEQKNYLIRGTDFIDNYFEWKGCSVRGQFQTLSFPRERIYDDRGYEIHGIPDKLKRACVEAAYLNSVSGSDSLFGTADTNGKIKKQKVDSLEVEYFEGTKSVQGSVNYTSIYDILNKLLKGLYKTKTDLSATNTRARWGY